MYLPIIRDGIPSLITRTKTAGMHLVCVNLMRASFLFARASSASSQRLDEAPMDK